jgi:hypothetical protein
MPLTAENILVFTRKADTPSVVLDEMGDIDKGNGIRLTQWPFFLEVSVNTPCASGWMRIPTSQVLSAIEEVSAKVGQ